MLYILCLHLLIVLLLKSLDFSSLQSNLLIKVLYRLSRPIALIEIPTEISGQFPGQEYRICKRWLWLFFGNRVITLHNRTQLLPSSCVGNPRRLLRDIRSAEILKSYSWQEWAFVGVAILVSFLALGHCILMFRYLYEYMVDIKLLRLWYDSQIYFLFYGWPLFVPVHMLTKPMEKLSNFVKQKPGAVDPFTQVEKRIRIRKLAQSLSLMALLVIATDLTLKFYVIKRDREEKKLFTQVKSTQSSNFASASKND